MPDASNKIGSITEGGVFAEQTWSVVSQRAEFNNVERFDGLTKACICTFI